ncbi:MAG: hypothetical protein ACYTFO_05250 [Planctomycetota bacterium]|jgi:hypothetical protein
MDHTEQERMILERMAPGALCAEGFLGHDHRELPEIIAADTAAVEALSLTHEQIAAKLAGALERAIADLGRPVELLDHLTATWHEGMGRIPSPWPGDGVFPKGELELTDNRSGRSIRITPLSIHLIAAHGFYQGWGAPYRLEPADLAAMFDLA